MLNADVNPEVISGGDGGPGHSP